MNNRFRYFLWLLVFSFLFFAGYISKFSEIIFISHSYIFALLIFVNFIVFSTWLISTQKLVNKETFNPIIWITLVIFVVLIFTSKVRYDSIFETYRIVAPIFLFLILINIIRNETDWKNFVYIFLCFGLFVSVLSYINFYTYYETALYSIWGYQNTFAAFLVLMIMLSFGIYLDTKERTLKMLLSVIPIFLIFLLFLTTSRGGYIAFIVSIVIFLVVSPKREAKNILKSAIPIIIGSILLIIFGSPREILLSFIGKTSTLINYLGGEQDTSLGMRVYLAKLAFEIFLKKPVFGFGLGSFRYTFTKYNTQDAVFRIDPHSLFFKFLAETGIVGTSTICILVLHFLKKSFEKIKRFETNFTYIGLFAGSVGMIFHMCIDVDIYPIMFIVAFISLALLATFSSEFVELKLSHRQFIAIVAITVVLIIGFDLYPKAVASTYVILGENPNFSRGTATSVEYFKKATELDKKSSAYEYALGEAISKSMTSYNDTKKVNEMIQTYEKAYELNPYDCRAPFKLGIVYLYQRDQKAIDYLLKANALYPTNSNILEWLSVAYAYVPKDIEKANYYLAVAKNYNINGLDLAFVQGIIELSKGNKSEADKYFSKLSFYNEINREISQNQTTNAKNRYALQLKIIADVMKDIKGN